MRTTGHTHDTVTSVRPSRPCSQALEAKAELAAINESDCASSGFAMAGYLILTLSQLEVHPNTMTSLRRRTDKHKQP